MKEQSDYRKLPGSGQSFLGFGRSRLWLAQDHVLMIQRRGYVEDYKRFYFRDIRAIVIRKTAKFSGINVAAGLLLIISLLLHMFGFTNWDWDMAGHIALGILTATLCIILILNLLNGPTCATKLVTAVHTVMIPSMNRIRTSFKVLRILQNKINEIQGQLTREILLQHPGIEEPPVLFPSPLKESSKTKIVNDNGSMHLLLFFALVVDAGLTALSLFNRSQILLIVSLIYGVPLWVLIVLSLIRQRKKTLPASVTGLTWGVLIYSIVYYAWSYLYHFVIAIQNPMHTSSQWDWVKMIWELSPLENPGLFVLLVFSVACSLSLGIAGLISVLRLRARINAQKKIEVTGGEAA